MALGDRVAAPAVVLYVWIVEDEQDTRRALIRRDKHHNRCQPPSEHRVYFGQLFGGMPTANANGWIESEGSIGEVSARRIYRQPSDRLGSPPFAVGIQKKRRQPPSDEEPAAHVRREISPCRVTSVRAPFRHCVQAELQ